MILTKEITYTLPEIEQVSTCSEAGDGYIYYEGTTKSCQQYMGALLVLNACYDLLKTAGFNVQKDETDQSLTIWGLKLKFANVGPKSYNQYYCINIHAPEIQYGCKVQCDGTYYYTYTKTNYFLQRSEYFNNSSYNESTDLGNEIKIQEYTLGHQNSLKLYNNYTYSVNDIVTGNILFTLYCSNDGIQIHYKQINKNVVSSSDSYPLLSIYKGKNIINNKEILIVGQMLEKAPYLIPSSGIGFYMRDDRSVYRVPHRNYAGSTYNANYSWIPFGSAYICSGSNVIYEKNNHKWTKTKDTLYLDSERFIDSGNPNLQILEGTATGNCGKYEVYGIAKVIDELVGITPESLYQVNNQKYWCRYPYNSIIVSNKILNNFYIYYTMASVLNDSIIHLLKCPTNSFGCGAIVPPTSPEGYDKLVETNPYFYNHYGAKPSPDSLNPYILLRIDDEIIDK